jgi:hypothetical protein
MGADVLDTGVDAGPSSGVDRSRLRAYAHCAPGGGGALTALVVNLDCGAEVEVSFDAGSQRDVYLLTADDLLAHEVRLGERALRLEDDGSPPPLVPEQTTDPVVVPPHSYAFVSIPDAAAVACGAAP